MIYFYKSTYFQKEVTIDKSRSSQMRNGERRRRSRSRSRDRRRRSPRRRSRSRSRDRKSTRRKKTYIYWDKAPPGCEHVTPAQYKAMQAANQIPGQPLSEVLPAELGIPTTGSQVSYQARRLFVGSIPFGITDHELLDFFNQQMQLNGLSLGDGNPVLASQVNFEKNFAFVEFRSPEETTLAMAFDGICFNGKSLTIKRPTNYQQPMGFRDNPSVVNNSMLDVLGAGTSESTSTQIPMQMQIPGVSSMQCKGPSTEVLCLLNMVTVEELKDDEEYEDILDDIKEECSRYGQVKSVEIPRPIDTVDVPGLGKVFIEFNSVLDCQKAQLKLTGRKFANRTVVTSYFDPDRYHRRDF